ncbi:MAG: hypothetical protein ABIK62_06950, partial [candidate division WOR-3 bacterium]
MTVPQSSLDLARIVQQEGGVLLGIADLCVDNLFESLWPQGIVWGKVPFRATTGLSFAVPVARQVLATIGEHPNQLYFHHYRQLNNQLDRIALRLTQVLEQRGVRALPIPASQIVDWQTQRGLVSHKRIAVAAGLGWIGRNNLLVTRAYGAQVRLASVLTDLPIGAARDLVASFGPECSSAFGCRECRACITVCPAQAIRDEPSEFDHQACFAQLREFQRQGYVGQYVCGICVRACGPRAGSISRAGSRRARTAPGTRSTSGASSRARTSATMRGLR